MNKTLILTKADLPKSRHDTKLEDLKLTDFVAIYHLTRDYSQIIYRDGKQEKKLK